MIKVDVRIVLLVGTIVSVFIGYLLGNRKDRKRELESRVSESLNQIVNPLFYDLIKIKRTKVMSPNLIKGDLKEFFEKYIGESNLVYKLYYPELIEEYHKLFVEYKTNSIDINSKVFWKDFDSFAVKIEDLYLKLINANSMGVIWEVERKNMNFWERIMHQFIISIGKFSNYFLMVNSIMFAYILSDRFLHKNSLMIPEELLWTALELLIMSIGLKIATTGTNFMIEKKYLNNYKTNSSILDLLNQKLIK